MARYKKTTATVMGGHVGNAVGGGGHVSFIPVVVYRYSVNGQEFTNNAFSQNPVGRRPKSRVQRIVDKYPVNSTIEIYYNPANPADSFIQKGFGQGANLAIRGMLVVALLALIATLIFTETQVLIDLF